MQPPTPSLLYHPYPGHRAPTEQAPRVDVTLTATSLTSVYINHLYYVVGPTRSARDRHSSARSPSSRSPHTLTAARFPVSSPGGAADGEHDGRALQRNARYTSVASLQPASSSAATARRGRSSRPARRQEAAAGRRVEPGLARRMAAVDAPRRARPPRGRGRPVARRARAGGYGDAIEIDFGDLVSWLRSASTPRSRWSRTSPDVWHFVVSIGEAVYHGPEIASKPSGRGDLGLQRHQDGHRGHLRSSSS